MIMQLSTPRDGKNLHTKDGVCLDDATNDTTDDIYDGDATDLITRARPNGILRGLRQRVQG
jgi:hypothetical protein